MRYKNFGEFINESVNENKAFNLKEYRDLPKVKQLSYIEDYLERNKLQVYADSVTSKGFKFGGPEFKDMKKASMLLKMLGIFNKIQVTHDEELEMIVESNILNESKIRNPELLVAVKNAEILSDWYNGKADSNETADKLTKAYKEIYGKGPNQYNDIVNDTIKELRGMKKPDSKASSGSMFHWFTDIDTEELHDAPYYDEAEKLILKSFRK